MALKGLCNSEKIWNYLKDRGLTDFGAAGLLGNIDCESGCNPKNMQDSFEKSLNYNDDSYTQAVDNGTYSNFVYDGVGYGITQTTYYTRKRNLLNYAKEKNKSIGDLELQLDFLYKELSENFKDVLSVLKSAKSISEASDIVLLKFEVPYDAKSKIEYRRSVSEKYYNKYKNISNNIEVEKLNLTGYATYKKGLNSKITEHFGSTEFDCHGVNCCSETIINMKLLNWLEQIREYFNSPITITSGYRCNIHNSSSSVGGAWGSRHTKGDACDIVVKDVAPRKVAQFCEGIGILGIGLYETSKDGFFVHIDTRDYKSFWYGKAEVAVSTFTNTNSTASSNNVSNNSILSFGSKGSLVKTLQENLIKLGFDCGDADGDYGSKTSNAVKELQRKNNLISDGIAGTQTLRAITTLLGNLSSNLSSNANSYRVRVNATRLNVRNGAGTNYNIIGEITDKGVYEIVSESNGTGANKWGKLSDNKGWISLDFCTKI